LEVAVYSVLLCGVVLVDLEEVAEAAEVEAGVEALAEVHPVAVVPAAAGNYVLDFKVCIFTNFT
jgi:hypothetical protein